MTSRNFKLGSLFDGSGGFPFAGALCGIVPVWASEVEPYPIAVTRSRFPDMKHLGNISDIHGGNIEPVDVITFGSPCQDLSVAGKRAGLKHEANGDEETTRSGLFMEAVRIIKEMREATDGKYPSFALWENVPGAFSSNKGEDFRIVLEELIKIVEPGAVMPSVPARGWAYADSYVGDGWSLAYRVFNAQHWGVPQRRRRIHLVLDLRGERAREVLFEREGVRGYFEASRTPWQGTAATVGASVETDDGAEEIIAFHLLQDPISSSGHAPCLSVGGSNGAASIGVAIDVESCYPVIAHSLTARHDGSPQPDKGNGANIIVQAAGFKAGNSEKAHGIGYANEVAPTLSAAPSGTNQAPGVIYSTLMERRRPEGAANYTYQNVTGPLMANAHPGGYCGQDAYSDMLVVENANDKVIAIDRAFFNQGKDALYEPQLHTDGTAATLVARGPSAVCTQHIVRRLTPSECARLQGFPDRWGEINKKDMFTFDEYGFWVDIWQTKLLIDGTIKRDDTGRLRYAKTGKLYKVKTKARMLNWYNKLHTDSAEYKMWGNGIALPPALYCMQGIADALNED